MSIPINPLSLSCDARSLIQLFGAIVAVVAAALWFGAWLVKLPPIAGTYEIKEEIGRLTIALRRQARLNGLAALSAAIAAALQFIQAYEPTCAILG